MTMRYDAPKLSARAANELIRWMSEAGISIAGTRALRVRGRKTGKRRGVVVNMLTVATSTAGTGRSRVTSAG
jgi:hypothetical protein